MTNGEQTSTSDIEKLRDLIKKIKFAMLTTVHENGTVHSRPMVCQEVEFDGDLWFFTGKDTEKVSDIKKIQKVNVSYSAPDDSKFVSVTGEAEIIDDRTKAAELWNPLYRAWFPEGLADPNLTLLKVRVTSAEYWDSPSSKVTQLVTFAKAIATGHRPKPSPSEHGKIEVRH